MKKILITLLLFNIGLLLHAQSVTFTANRIEYDDKPLLMNGNFGDWTNYQYVEFINQSGGRVSVSAHLHHDLKFIYFVDAYNNAVQNIEVTVPARGRYTLKVVARLETGEPTVYNDLLGFEITYSDHRTGYFELNSSTYFYNRGKSSVGGNSSSGHHGKDNSRGNSGRNSRGGSNRDNASNNHGDNSRNNSGNSNRGSNSSSSTFYKPSGYSFIGYGYQEVNSGSPMRWNKSDFPLVIYSNHASNGYASDYGKLIQKALDMWNVTGNSIGINTTIFRMTNNRNSADIQMDWSGSVLRNAQLSSALGVAIPGENRVGMWSLRTYKSKFKMSLGDVGEVLVQELGHLLGPVHSEVRNDIMNGTAHGDFHELSEIKITDRDRQMLGWIYSQNRYSKFRK